MADNKERLILDQLAILINKNSNAINTSIEQDIEKDENKEKIIKPLPLPPIKR